MKFKETMIWSAVHNDNHPKLTEEERKISGYMPLVNTLFPGINYYSISGFSQVMSTLVRPALTKLFPQMVGKTADQVSDETMVEINEFLPSKGYEWSDSAVWQDKFTGLVAA